MRAWLPSRRSTLAQRGAAVNWRSGQVRSCSTSGTCERYLSNGMGDGSQGRARRPRSTSPPLPFCPSSMCFIPSSLCIGSSLLGPNLCRPNKKPPGRWRRRLRANAMWRSPSGKQQVGGRGLHFERILPSGRGPRQGRPQRRAEAQQVAVAVGVRRLPHAEARIEQVAVSPTPAASHSACSASASSTADVGGAPPVAGARSGTCRKWMRTPSRTPCRSHPRGRARETQGLVVGLHRVHVGGREDGGDALRVAMAGHATVGGCAASSGQCSGPLRHRRAGGRARRAARPRAAARPARDEPVIGSLDTWPAVRASRGLSASSIRPQRSRRKSRPRTAGRLRA